MSSGDDLPDFYVNYKLLSEPPTSEHLLNVEIFTQTVPAENVDSTTK